MMNKQHKLYIQIRSIEMGTYAATYKAELVLCVGNPMYFRDYPYKFKASQKHDINHTWTFNIVHEGTGNFLIVLYKHHLLGNKEIGQIQFSLAGFPPNTVVTQKFVMQSANPNAFPAVVEADIHVCENGAPAFHAPPAKLQEGGIVQTRFVLDTPEVKIC
ncbi:hypothetical protein TVAG_442080 [Trichomonas vaginalis G3]|uniref:Uncharacterized protein n=1 Tax=Trichomonas vaginalis (strain ATCC PRA-98 / G3) TaxID=412133 RepID=A2F1V2_TRIV3|nr:hypothetical protein TVAGG3_0505800 [Trichomonas vaginalis G3]EAY01097.1 hypothetical protein TVAG_442080 [Trichomonas vaginalis G3]KAI5517414.1 hypothetical protein TVAGG3_0505800 [Trichomonas vaginalis G3]|eukprot:XP_001313949.1 hypothetical protein [Trichomonas vaginalis G3]